MNFFLTVKIYTFYLTYRIITKWLLENGLELNQIQNDRHSIDITQILGLENEGPISLGNCSNITHLLFIFANE